MRKKISGSGLGTLVVVELGGEWPALKPQELQPHSTVRVVVQNDGETPNDFAERVANGIDAAFGRGTQLASLRLACNERTDVGATDARRKIAALCLGGMAKHKAGKAYLTAAQRSSGRLRHALSALAHGLHDEWRTAGLEASVDFGEDAAAAAAGLDVQLTNTARVA